MIRAFLLSCAILLSSVSWAKETTTFVFAKIAESIMPIARGAKYEDPLDAALKKAGLGEVTGGGSSLAKDKTIEWVGVDIELSDLNRGIPFLRKKLRELGAPKGSVLEYKLNGRQIQLPVHE